MLKREKLKAALGKSNGHQSTEFSTVSALKIKTIAAIFLPTLKRHEFGHSPADVKSVFKFYSTCKLLSNWLVAISKHILFRDLFIINNKFRQV